MPRPAVLVGRLVEAAPFLGPRQGPARQFVGNRIVPLALVVLLHAVALFLLTLHKVRATRPAQQAAIKVSILQEPAVPDTPPPALPAVLERPAVAAIHVPVPRFDIADSPPVPAAPAGPAAPQAVAATAKTEAPTGDAIAPPRFDAGHLRNPAPAYPPISRRLREQGVVVLRVRVTPVGTAAQVQVFRSSGSVRLDAAAANAVARWRFVPARRGAHPVEAWVLVPVEFELQG